MKKRIIVGLVTFQMIAFNAIAQSIEINFDTDAFGNPITAPYQFINTVRLSELYAPLGVHFWGPDGPDGRDGGAILDQDSGFGINARSGSNFFAFNRLPAARMMDGGIPRDPETISFDTLAAHISIFAAGAGIYQTFLMQGFDADGVLVASDAITTLEWGELEIASPSGIKSVQLSSLTNTAFYFVFDDLSVDFVPEPSAISLLICAAALGLALQLRRKKT
jgi:hypothetical protein